MFKHKEIYVIPSHTKKVFANMKRQGKYFFGRVTPLFPTMIVQAQEELGKDTEIPTDTQHIPTIIQPTTSQPQRKQKPRRTRRKDTKLSQTSVPTEVVADEAVCEEMYDYVERAATTAAGLDAYQDRGIISMIVNILGSREDRLKLTELMELCTQLQSRVFALETTKTNQALEIGSLKIRVKKLKKKAIKRTYNLNRLYKIDSSRRSESSDEASLGDQEDASKQGRIIDNLDADEGVTLEVGTANPVTTTSEVVTTTGVKVSAAATTHTISMDDITLAKALASLKSAKPMVKEPSVPISAASTSPKVSAVSTTSTTVTTTTPKAKGIVMQEPKETTIRTTTAEEEANKALIAEWDDVQAMMDADHELAERLQAEEQG
nr:hypothetical protein [Tanacetum cinerariifolium]